MSKHNDPNIVKIREALNRPKQMEAVTKRDGESGAFINDVVSSWKAEELLWREREEELLRKLASYEAGAENLIRELDKARKQAEGQCDGCGEDLDDAFCTKCKDGAEPAATEKTASENTHKDSACPECSRLASRVEELEKLLAKHSGSLSSADSASNTESSSAAKEIR